MRAAILFTAAVALALSAGVARANVKLPDVLGDSMVLQQKHSVPVWGTADPGEEVTVRFAGQTKRATAGADARRRTARTADRIGGEPAMRRSSRQAPVGQAQPIRPRTTSSQARVPS